MKLAVFPFWRMMQERNTNKCTTALAGLVEERMSKVHFPEIATLYETTSAFQKEQAVPRLTTLSKEEKEEGYQSPSS